MKHLKHFANAQEAATILATWPFNTISSIEGQEGVHYSKGVPPGPDYSEPFYINVRGPVTLAATSGLQMSTDKTNWTDTTATTLSTGKTYFRVATDQSSPLKPDWTEDGNSDYDIGGNINSLVKTNFENDTTCYDFKSLCESKTKLKSAGNLILPATTLVNKCYYGMFYKCTSLTTAPVLPATTLADQCYMYMFVDCTSLTTAPALPATTLAFSCYYQMFWGCTSLTTAPELPATTVVKDCCREMFRDCTSLTTAPAILPATTLIQRCYNGMFWGCTSLTTAPELPATTLVQGCYTNMFNGCTNLNYIKCLATNISATSCTYDWVNGVAATGTFVKDPSMSSWTTGANGIPSGWTVEDAA